MNETRWDERYTQSEVFEKKQEGFDELIKLLKREKTNRVLDLGCGSGRNLLPLVEAGFQVTGTDNSSALLEFTRKRLEERGLNAELKESDCYERFPFKDGYFDAVVSIQVIHHNTHDKIKHCISEIERVLKPNGIIFITVTTDSYKKKERKLKKVAPQTYVPQAGREKGITHYIYRKEQLEEDFNKFEILKLFEGASYYIDDANHYCILGRLKA
ncbi:MAG: class I SAM-dependent methyltransferase [Candidatus Micrarchaeia archaeon]